MLAAQYLHRLMKQKPSLRQRVRNVDRSSLLSRVQVGGRLGGAGLRCWGVGRGGCLCV